MFSAFKATREKEWKARTSDNTATVRRLTADLRQKRMMQSKQVERYLQNDKNVLPVYEQMSSQFQDDIALLESQIARHKQRTPHSWSSQKTS